MEAVYGRKRYNQVPECVRLQPVLTGSYPTTGTLYERVCSSLDVNSGTATTRPEESIMVYWMSSDKPEGRMPEIGRTLGQEEGVELIREWNESMDCKSCENQ